jgi:diguanylate cyclase (GGDEF)-like protein/PAS domain S-box-containing protein
MSNLSTSNINSQNYYSNSDTAGSKISKRKSVSENKGKITLSGKGISPYLYLLIVEDSNNQRIFYLNGEQYNLGRSDDNSIILYDQQVSRCHATIVKEYNEGEQLFFYKIYDGNLKGKLSTNGLFINGVKFQEKYLEHGDLIRFSEKAKAHYFVLDKNSKINDIFKLTDTGDNSSKEPHLKRDDIDKITLTSDETFWKQIDNDQYHHLSKIASFCELSPYPIIEVNLQGQITYCNESASLRFKDIFEKKLSHPLLTNILKPQNKIYGSLFVREVQIGDQFFEQYIHYLPQLQLIRSYIFDFTERKRAEAKLKDSEAKYRAIIQQTSEGIFLVDAYSREIREVNQAACDLLGYSHHELIGQDVGYFLVENHDTFKEYLDTLISDKQHIMQELKYKTKLGKIIDVELNTSRINYENKEIFCLVFRDITKRKKLEAKLKHIAYHDTLTGVYNRILFNEHLTKALANAKRANSLMGIMFLDLDHFKEINDNYGHNVGDGLLKKFAKRLVSCIRVGDTLARWGGDEFTILLPNVESREDLSNIAQRILICLQQPFQVHQYQLVIRSSIGIAIYPEDALDSETLIKKADIALYCTKQKGRNGFLFYQQNM